MPVTNRFRKRQAQFIQPILANKRAREQSLAQMAIAWVLRGNHVTSALVGASRVSQIVDNVAALNNLAFTESELKLIDEILKAE